MNNLDKQYQNLLCDILENGIEKTDRTGTGTLSVFGRQIRHRMSEGFPLLTTKKMAWKSIVTELLWFLRGDTNIKYLVDNNCHIWDGDVWKNYERRWENEGKFLSPPVNKFTKEELINEIKTNSMVAKEFGELGPVYGAQWRRWGRKNVTNYDLKDVKCSDQPKVVEAIKNGEDVSRYGVKIEYQNNSIDQIQNLIDELKTNPDSRRLMVSAWNVGELDKMVLPPCHYGFQIYTRELSQSERFNWYGNKIGSYMHHDRIEHEMNENNVPTRAISLMWNQRSVDTFLGLPFNIASYGLLLELIANEVNMIPDELIGNLGDTHLYLNHVNQAKEQIGRDLTDEERYHIWFNNNYETGMERWFDPNNLPDFEDKYYIPTPKKTREPYKLPKLKFHLTDDFWNTFNVSLINRLESDRFVLEDYVSHSGIKAPLSN